MDKQITPTSRASGKPTPVPFILKQLFEELQKDEPLLADIAKIIAQDVSLSALVVRTADSAYFGLKSKVSSIQHATSLLGIKTTANIVAGLALKRTFEEGPGINPPNYWDSPMNIAALSAYVARSMSGVDADEAYMLGLFHNSGHAVMMNKFGDYGEFLPNHLNLAQTVTELEDARYSTNHAVLGYYLAKSWGLDANIARLIRDHHFAGERLASDNAGADETLLAILKVCEHADKVFWGMDPDQEWLAIEQPVIEHLGLSKPDYDDLETDLLEKLREGFD